MESIIIPFLPKNLGRVNFDIEVMSGERKSFDNVRFKLDSGSDFTTISCEELYNLGYSREFLENCPYHHINAVTASEYGQLKLQYITNISIKFADREIQGCRIFFALDTKLRSLFGSDILKYFNWEVNYDLGILKLTQVNNKPLLSEGESPLQIYLAEEER